MLAAGPSNAANEQIFVFSIPAQRADLALTEYARITGEELLFPFDLVSRFRTNQLEGEYTAVRGLEILLQNTGLAVTASSQGNLLVHAQSSDTVTAGPAENVPTGPPKFQANRIEEIIVTATKRGEQTLQSIPASIFAMDQVLLERMGVINFADFAANVAGLDLVDSGPGDKKYIIRGINGVGEAQVAVYYDNMPITGIATSAADFGGSQTDFDLFDIERVEVMRGPQGTLYGANSMSGVVRVIANKPDAGGFHSAVELDTASVAGGNPNYSLKGMINIPLAGERLAFRGVVYYKDFGGFVDAVDIPVDYQKLNFFGPGIDAPATDDDTWETADVNTGKTSGIRLALAGRFSENTSLLAQLYHQDMETGGKPHIRPAESRNVVTDVAFGGAGDLNNVVYAQNVYDDKTTMANLTLDHDLGWSALTASLSTFKRDVFSEGDTSVSFKNLIPAPVVPFSGFLQQPQESDMTSFELRLNTRLEGPVNALVGGFYQDRDNDYENWMFLLDGPNNPDTSTRRFNRLAQRQYPHEGIVR